MCQLMRDIDHAKVIGTCYADLHRQHSFGLAPRVLYYTITIIGCTICTCAETSGTVSQNSQNDSTPTYYIRYYNTVLIVTCMLAIRANRTLRSVVVPANPTKRGLGFARRHRSSCTTTHCCCCCCGCCCCSRGRFICNSRSVKCGGIIVISPIYKNASQLFTLFAC